MSAATGVDPAVAELDAVAASRLIRAGALSPVDLLAALAERIERTEPGVRGFADLRLDRAWSAARDAERQVLRGADLGPLHGVPVAAKRLFAMPWSARPAEVLRRLEDAGAIVLGATWAPNPGGFTAPTRNPWDPARTPGWSSSGSAAVVASRAVPLALGSDTVGSVRIPAALCGVAGLRPTQGVLPRDGLALLSAELDEVGLLARTVRDLALAFAVLRGGRTPDPGRGRPRIAVPGGGFQDRVDPELLAAVEAVAAALDARPGRVAVPAEAFDRRWSAPLMHTSGRRDRDPAARLPAAVIAGWAAAFDRADVLLAPAVPVPAGRLDATTARHADGSQEDYVAAYPRLCRPASLLGYPALTVPCGLSAAGLPVAVQLIGRPGGEAELFRVGAAVERARPPLPAPPAAGWTRDQEGVPTCAE